MSQNNSGSDYFDVLRRMSPSKRLLSAIDQAEKAQRAAEQQAAQEAKREAARQAARHRATRSRVARDAPQASRRASA